MLRSAIIVAGGSGTRMGADIPKQFLELNGKAILVHTVMAFLAFDADMEIIVVLPAAHADTWRLLAAKNGLEKVVFVAGGMERSDSVTNGLNVATGKLIAIHDGVRPFVSATLINRCFSVAENKGSAIPVVPITSSVRQVSGEGSKAIDRSTLKAVQTPQCFKADLLRLAFAERPEVKATDEASLVELLGHQVHLVAGEENNLKITTPFDLKMAEVLLS